MEKELFENVQEENITTTQKKVEERAKIMEYLAEHDNPHGCRAKQIAENYNPTDYKLSKRPNRVINSVSSLLREMRKEKLVDKVSERGWRLTQKGWNRFGLGRGVEYKWGLEGKFIGYTRVKGRKTAIPTPSNKPPPPRGEK